MMPRYTHYVEHKMKKIVGIILMMTCVVLHAKMAHNFVYHEFDVLMDTAPYYPKVFFYTDRVLKYDGRILLSMGRSLYNQYNPNVLKPCEVPTIPKIIHQIWIGGPIPDVFKKYMKTWQDMHPDWQYIVWTDEKIKELFPLYNQAFFDQADGMGVKSDLLKWEIVYRFGGVYADVDHECLQSFDLFHHTYDFYTALQPFDANFIQLGASLFAARPGHPILKHCIETIKDDWHHKGAPKKSGPVHFSKSFMHMAGKQGNHDIVLPAFYFYPLGSTETVLKKTEWLHKGAYAVHHWAKSWMPKEYRRTEFRTFDNEQSSKVWNE